MDAERRGRATDAVLRALGRRGRYQLLQVNLMLLGALISASQLFNNVFIGAQVNHRCSPETNVTRQTDLDSDSSGVMVYEKCRQGLLFNSSNHSDVIWQPCQHGWTYEKADTSSTVSQFDLVCDRGFLSQLSQTLFIAGQGLGALFFPALSDRIGRRPMVLATHLGALALAVVLSFSPSYAFFAVVRVLIGAMQQGVILGVGTYTIEQFATSDRLLAGAGCQLSWGLAVVVITPVVFLLRHQSWRVVQGALAALGSVVFFQFLFQDESLRWLIANGRVKQARRLMWKAARQNGKDYSRVLAAYEEVMCPDGHQRLEPMGVEMKEAADSSVPEHDVKTYSLLDFFRSRTLMTYLVILWFLWFTDSMTYFSLYLSAGSIHGDLYVNFLLNALADLPSTLLFWLFLERIGRRWSMLLFHAMAAVPLLLVTLLRHFLAVDISTTVLAFIGKLGISSAFNSLFFYTPEVFPTNLRNLGTGTSSLAARAGGMLAPFAGKLAAIYPWAPGAVFSGCCFIVIALIFQLPETKGRTLPSAIEEVEAWQRNKPPCLRKRTAL